MKDRLESYWALPRVQRGWEVAKRVLVRTYTDGFIHAGNLAYLSLIALFPFFIVATAIASAVGQTDEGLHALEVVLATLPHGISETLSGPIREVMAARNGPMLWMGGLIGLWTVGSFIETLRDILRRAYGTRARRKFWQYRLFSAGLIIGAVVLLFFSFSLQIITMTIEDLMSRFLPPELAVFGETALTRGLAIFGMFVALQLLFISLTPLAYRGRKYPKWPGALFVMIWWQLLTYLMPMVVSGLVSYDLTYGSLASVMITLFFFYLIGLGIVIGAELNAALAEGTGAVPWNRIGPDDLDGAERVTA